MATIIDVNEEWGENADWSHAGEPGSGRSTTTRKFNVTHSTDARPLEVLADPRIPQKSQPHPWNFYWRCRGSSATRKSPILTEVVSKYDVKSFEGGGDDPENPLDAPPRVRYLTINSEGEVQEDIQGNQIVTFNAEVINGVMKPFADLGVTITRNLPTFNPTSIYTYVNTVNSSTFLGFPTGTCKINSIEADNVNDEDYAYWVVTVEMQFRKPINTTAAHAWWARIRHEGYKVKIVGLPVDRIETATDDNQQFVSRPVLLYSTGEEITDPDDTTEAWIEREIFESTDFNTLNLL